MADEKRPIPVEASTLADRHHPFSTQDLSEALPAYDGPPPSGAPKPDQKARYDPLSRQGDGDSRSGSRSRPLSAANSLHLEDMPEPPSEGFASHPSNNTPPRSGTSSKRASLAAGDFAAVSVPSPLSLPQERAQSRQSPSDDEEEPIGVTPDELRISGGPGGVSEENLDEAEAEVDALPTESHPTVAFAIPFPEVPDTETAKKNTLKDKIPPFVLYLPVKAPLKAPTKLADGEGDGDGQEKKEGMIKKVQRKWQEEERSARERPVGWKAKSVNLISRGMSATKNSSVEFLGRTPSKKKLKELRIVYPSSYSSTDMLSLFTVLLKTAKSGAIRSGIIATAILPFVVVADVLTPVPGPAEINTVWAVSSWKGAARASAISSGITGGKLPVSFMPSDEMNDVARRLHEICWQKAPRPGIVRRPERLVPKARGDGGETAKGPTEALEDEEEVEKTALKVEPARAKDEVEVGPEASTSAAAPPPRTLTSGTTPLPPPPPNRAHVQKRGPQLAEVLLNEIVKQGGELDRYERDKRLLSEDLGKCLEKGAKEWLKLVV